MRRMLRLLAWQDPAVVFGPNGEYPGIWVESTTTGGIADKAGILPGDIIHEVETISDRHRRNNEGLLRHPERA